MTRAVTLPLLVAASLPFLAHAKSPAIVPGTYVLGYGSGDLTIAAQKNDKQEFNIDVVGANAHTCTLSGQIEGEVARLTEGDQVCQVRFVPKNGGVDVMVDGDQEPCRAYCGVRAWFEGFYLSEAPKCRAKKVEAERARFKKLYDKKAYAEARDILRAVLDQCAQQSHESVLGWVRNDLAITYHKLKDDASCLEVLKPLAELANTPDDDIKGMGPADAEYRIPIAKAARHNLKLCGK
jgi:hypothetical protein